MHLSAHLMHSMLTREYKKRCYGAFNFACDIRDDVRSELQVLKTTLGIKESYDFPFNMGHIYTCDATCTRVCFINRP